MIMLQVATVMAVLLAAASPAVAPAQGPPRSAAEPCFRARPAPDCSVFFLTNAGGYITPGNGDGASPLRAVVDWGVMVNVSQRAAIGGSWFVTLDEDDLSTGPVVRYRRWFERERSLNLAVGTPIASGEGLKTGSVLALVKYQPVHWFGVALRPEYVRRSSFVCDPLACTERTTSSGRVYAGVELGWFPGLTLSLVGGAALGVFAIALASAYE